MYSRLSARCPHCPKTVAIKFSTERFIVHDTPEGVECEGSGASPYLVEASPAPVEEKPKPKRKAKRRRTAEGRGGSVWTVSGGLPGLGKRR